MRHRQHLARRPQGRRAAGARSVLPSLREAGPEAGTGSAEARLEELRREYAHLREAMVRRPVVDQARGVVMAVGDCGAQEAWEVLVGTSQRTNTTLREVAGMVVASVGGAQIPEPVASQLRQSLGEFTEERK
ncbi:ANTAR domain-containing protein [Streptomyces sp. MNP-20]|uniref:ANTAR domain-containing protein n=1 Tax=Streptomyces sp. MNP-20 TaxID=2721165 RepID=UPI0015538D0C|nr:ANTAR domain-containing protein [Streptomyces sp. MNP-20]